MNLFSKLCAILACAEITFFLAGPALADDVSVAGTWAISGTAGAPGFFFPMSPVCTLKQDGKEIHGTCKGPNDFGVATGAVDGRKVFLQWAAGATTDRGFNGTVTMHGTLDNDGFIRGTFTVSIRPDAGGTFSGQKVK